MGGPWKFLLPPPPIVGPSVDAVTAGIPQRSSKYEPVMIAYGIVTWYLAAPQPKYARIEKPFF